MHELAIAESIVQAVCSRAAEYKTEHVTSVRVQIGEANAVVADSLIFCFEMIASDEPMLTNVHLLIESVAHRARCRHCEKEFSVIHFVTQCPICETWDADVISGTEFAILEMEIAPPSTEKRDC